ncbi:hypothetical protein BDDG_13392 [Blastomyces dermatitidis ATCC 18188]|uniref:Uncharacterized protein n=1 Tax=Ajellomyces dermatitidis (strain ATCC 18188 / CBS 674.68) TaxID=653446 RepID=A0A0J9ET22_AJEDA|nr:hypothetical protein BDDG_13392 [Blastomyces dermatitidis ATCC 18188]
MISFNLDSMFTMTVSATAVTAASATAVSTASANAVSVVSATAILSLIFFKAFSGMRGCNSYHR